MALIFQGTHIITPEDTGVMIPISQIIAALPDYGPHGRAVRRELEDRLHMAGWAYLIAEDAFAPPSVIAKLRCPALSSSHDVPLNTF